MAPARPPVHAILRRAPDPGGALWLDLRQPAPTQLSRHPAARPEEVSRLVEAAYEADPDLAVLLWLAATTGARRGEPYALRWSSVDLDPAGRQPVHPDSVTHRFSRLTSQLGLRTRLHDLRRYAATQLIAGGVDVRTVSGRIGHELAPCGHRTPPPVRPDTW